MIEIPANERGVVRVFELALTGPEADAFAQPGEDGWPLRDALGADRLDPDHVESFPVKDLGELGLSRYLIDGMGVSEAEIAGHEATVDALTGHVVILRSAAFGGEAQTLSPSEPLRHVATLGEATPETPVTTLEAETAKGEVVMDPEARSRERKKSAARQSGMVATVVLIVLALLVVVMVLVAG